MSLTKVTNSMIQGAFVNVLDYLTPAELADVQSNTGSINITSKVQAAIDAAAAAKYKISEMFSKVVDECLQLHGGYGYMMEYPIARAYIDNRANRIYAGTNEIMKELISRSL